MEAATVLAAAAGHVPEDLLWRCRRRGGLRSRSKSLDAPRRSLATTTGSECLRSMCGQGQTVRQLGPVTVACSEQHSTLARLRRTRKWSSSDRVPVCGRGDAAQSRVTCGAFCSAKLAKPSSFVLTSASRLWNGGFLGVDCWNRELLRRRTWHHLCTAASSKPSASSSSPSSSFPAFEEPTVLSSASQLSEEEEEEASEPFSSASRPALDPPPPKEERGGRRREKYGNFFLRVARARTIFSDALELFFRSELRRRLFITVALIVLSRVGHFIPVPGFDRRLMPRDYLDVVSGVVEEFGDLNSALVLNLFQLGMSPFIMSSIIMQMLCLIVPHFVRARKEGRDGQDTIKWYTAAIAIVIAVMQSLLVAGMSVPFSLHAASRKFAYFFVTASYLTLGAWMLNKISDQISNSGFGSGSSFIISISILLGYADSLDVLVRNMQRGFAESSPILLFFAFFLLMTAGAVVVIEARRKVPMVYFQVDGGGAASRGGGGGSAVGSMRSAVAGDSDPYIPFNLNPEGMQPVLLATYFLSIPSLIAGATRNPTAVAIRDALIPTKGGPWVYYSLSFILIFVLNQLDFMDMPKEMAEYLTKIGARVPNVRPGIDTVKHLRFVHASARFWGGLLLALLTTVSGLIDQRYRATYPGLNIGFTSMLIIVGSIIQAKRAVVSYQQMPRLQKVLEKYRV